MTLISDIMKEEQISDAEIIEETKPEESVFSDPGASSDQTMEVKHLDADTPSKEELKIDDKPFTMSISPRSPFTPPGVVFIGSNPEANYHKWLERHFKEVIDSLGRERKSNGAYPKAYIHAVQFIRSAIAILNLHKTHAKVIYKEAVFPRPINQCGVVMDILNTNKDLINALIPLYAPEQKPAVKPSVNLDEAKALQPKEQQFTQEQLKASLTDAIAKARETGEVPTEIPISQ